MIQVVNNKKQLIDAVKKNIFWDSLTRIMTCSYLFRNELIKCIVLWHHHDDSSASSAQQNHVAALWVDLDAETMKNRPQSRDTDLQPPTSGRAPPPPPPPPSSCSWKSTINHVSSKPDTSPCPSGPHGDHYECLQATHEGRAAGSPNMDQMLLLSALQTKDDVTKQKKQK